MKQHIFIADRLRQVVFRLIKYGFISNKANEFKNSQVVVITLSATPDLWGLLMRFVFSFPVYSNTPLINYYPYFWWFKSWVHVWHVTTPSKYHKASELTFIWRTITAWYLYKIHTEQFVVPPWVFQSFCGTEALWELNCSLKSAAFPNGFHEQKKCN